MTTKIKFFKTFYQKRLVLYVHNNQMRSLLIKFESKKPIIHFKKTIKQSLPTISRHFVTFPIGDKTGHPLIYCWLICYCPLGARMYTKITSNYLILECSVKYSLNSNSEKIRYLIPVFLFMEYFKYVSLRKLTKVLEN